MTSDQDPTISRVRETRHLISERCGHDPRRLVAYYLRLQEDEATEPDGVPAAAGGGRDQRSPAVPEAK